MSLLLVLLPPRERLGARDAGSRADPGVRLPPEWSYVLSGDGKRVSQTGQAAPALLPRADVTALVMAEADVAWHRVRVPRAPASRMRSALMGVMEEALLDEVDATHLALASGTVAGAPGWVAATDGPRLAAAVQALESAGRTVDRVLCANEPGPGLRGHFFMGEGEVPQLALAHEDGAACVGLGGTLARALLAGALDGAGGASAAGSGGTPPRWSAAPAAAVAAEQWLGAVLPLLGEAERALEAAQSPTNLRQFDLAPRLRGTRALRSGMQHLRSAPWRAVRWGLGALLLVQLVGLNALAWQQQQALAQRRQDMHELLLRTHPGVRVVLDAPLQMERETARLRAAAGRAGSNDLEALLAAAAAAWPEAQGPVQSLRFEAGRLTLATPGWAEPQKQQFRQRLRGAGLSAEFAEGSVTVARGVV
jgi:general secretion pathway protein L